MTDKEIAKGQNKEPEQAEEYQDDIYDGLYRDVISREVARKEGRDEGRTVIVEMPEHGEDFISYGRREMVDEFDRRLERGRVKHRGVETGRFPATDDEKVERFKGLVRDRVSKATKRRKALERIAKLPELPGFIEKPLTKAEGTETGEEETQLIKIKSSARGAEPAAVLSYKPFKTLTLYSVALTACQWKGLSSGLRERS